MGKSQNTKLLVFIMLLVAAPFILLAASLVVSMDKLDPPYFYDLQSMMLTAPPAKLIYVAGKDRYLQFDGGILSFTHQSVNPGYVYYQGFDADIERNCIRSDIDFDREGVYTVSVARRRWLFFETAYFQFTVQVVAPGKYLSAPQASGDEAVAAIAKPGAAECENAGAIMLSPPTYIVYPVGYTGKINPAGIVIRTGSGIFSRKYKIEQLDYTLESDANFDTPGSYTVKIRFTDSSGAERMFYYTVAVAETTQK